jgi:hypothetical protein
MSFKKINIKKREKSIATLCPFLKLLWETCKDDYIEISLVKLSKSIGVSNANSVVTTLIKKGIISKKWTPKGRSAICTYKWSSKTEPNIHMANAIIDACNESHHKKEQLWSLKTNRIGLFY